MNQPIRIGINGFGRIGRTLTRLIAAHYSTDLQIVAVNDTGPEEALAHILKFDSVHGIFPGEVSYTPGQISIASAAHPRQVHHIKLNSYSNPAEIPWGDLGVDVVVESTGRFRSMSNLSDHLRAGAGKVILSAVPDGDGIKTIVLGANQHLLDGTEQIISNASCTTNCAAPLVDIIDRHFQIESGYITTVHSYTGDQSLHDKAHKDLRRARAAALSIIPTTTGAAKAITRVFPELEGKLGGAGIRVPVPNGSLTDVTYILKNKTTEQEVNKAFETAAAAGPWFEILQYLDLPLVSSDIIGNRHSCIFDPQLTSVLGNMVKVVGWYDNEAGYSSRLAELILYWSRLWA